MIHIKTDEIYGRNPITNAADFRTHLLSIDSRYRATQLEPTTDYLYKFDHPYKNIIQAKLASVEIPKGRYNLTKAKKNTMFRINVMDYTGQQHFLTIELPEGDYPTPVDLIQQIQQEFDAIKDVYGIFLRIQYNTRTHTTTISHDGSAPPPCPLGPTHTPTAFGITFMMIGQEDQSTEFGLGSVLGFLKPFYVTQHAPHILTSESPINLRPDAYYLLQIEDFHTTTHQTEDNLVHALAKIQLKPEQTSHAITYESKVLTNTITFTQPRDLPQIRVRLLDHQGEPVDLHDLNWSLTLELTEVMNVQLYDNYRTYRWTAEEPRVNPSTKGAGVPIAPPARNFN